MTPKETKIKYFLYARKSSESEDRQVQSIDDQIDRLKQYAKDKSLDIKEIYTEAKSAKKPNNRPLFDEMMERIEKGEANGILCWQINRLSRNPIDSGKLSWSLQNGILKSIRTMDREYLPEDNVLIFSVESGVANQYILDLRKNVQRGIQSKLQKGWIPSGAPLGYLNTKSEVKGENYIIKDPERFPLIRKAWDLMLTGSYTPPKILEILNNEWGFRTRQGKRRGNKPMSKSTIYETFTNPFYAGTIVWNGARYSDKQEPMVSLEEFDRVQIILGRKGKPRPKQHIFPFTGAIRCGECGCLITAIEKTKIIKTTGKLKTFTYYFCTRKKKYVNCSQRKHTTAQDLEMQIEKEIGKYTILPKFRDWASEVLNSVNDKEIADKTAICESRHKAITASQNQLDNLTRMRYRDLIGDEEFTRERTTVQNEINLLKQQLRETDGHAKKWLELTEKTFNFAACARKEFLMRDMQTKKEILMALGQNPMLKDKKLSIQANEWLKPIAESYPVLEKEYRRLELAKVGTNKEQNEDLTSLRLRWRGRPDLNRRSSP